jgi:plastocyanin
MNNGLEGFPVGGSSMRRSVLVMFGAAALAGGLWLVPVVFAADSDVSIAGFAFSPETITVTVGDSVTWTNQDGATHTATADGGSFNTGNIGDGALKSVTFEAAGTFAYHCSIHAAMTGTVVVEAASGGGGTPTTPPTDTVAPAARGARAPAGFLAVLFAVLSSLIVARRLSRPRS